MTATIELTHAQKVEIVAAFLQAGEAATQNKTAFAKQFNISPRTLGRYVGSFTQDALSLIAASKTEEKVETRGFKGRNGRMAMYRELFAEMGLDASAKELLAEANRREVAANLAPMSRANFYAMLCIERKRAGVNIKEIKKQRKAVV